MTGSSQLFIFIDLLLRMDVIFSTNCKLCFGWTYFVINLNLSFIKTELLVYKKLNINVTHIANLCKR